MKTGDEIKICAVANRIFWTERARFNLACMKYAGASEADKRLERASFRKNMAHRRAKTYLECRDEDL